jgi:hypothetical protein
MVDDESPMTTARMLAIASVAALAATGGDLLLLLVGNSLRPQLHLESPPAFVLTLGGLLGCVAIPLYGLGYAAVARVVRSSRPITARVIVFGGSAFALVGAFIHGMTWLTIRDSIHAGTGSGTGPGTGSGTASAAPVDAIVAAGGFLLGAWTVAAVLMLAVSLAIARSGLARRRPIPVRLALLNPVNVTILLGVAGAVTETGRAFIVPAAPNLAHVVFFGAALYALAVRTGGASADR